MLNKFQQSLFKQNIAFGSRYFSSAAGGVTLPTYSDVQRAAGVLDGVAHKTPVMTSKYLDNKLGAEIYFKCENFQKTGAFKFRGAYSAMAQLTDVERKAGIIAFSSGNHAQACSLSGNLLGVKASILMPEDAPQIKIEGSKGYGGHVLHYNRFTQDREAMAKEISDREGSVVIPSSNHFNVISGQGTITKELIEEVGELDYLFVCVGGGGNLAGACLSAAALSPNCKVIGVEPELGNDGQRSMREGKIIHIETPVTVADGAGNNHLGGPLVFGILQNHLPKEGGIITCTDETIKQCMVYFAERQKVIVEPTGCLAMAGLLDSGIDIRGKKVGVHITGGNCDAQKYASLIASMNGKDKI